MMKVRHVNRGVRFFEDTCDRILKNRNSALKGRVVSDFLDDIKVSVILPIYNASNTLEQALDSVLAQTHTNFEAICVNDGSTDDSLEIINRYVQKDARFKLIDKLNGGYGAACNCALASAIGDWIAILEPDDYLDPRTFETLLGGAWEVIYPKLDGYVVVEGDQNCAGATSRGAALSRRLDLIKAPYWRVRITDDGKELAPIHCTYHGQVRPKHQPYEPWETPEFLRHHPSIWSAIYSRRFLSENNITFPEYPGAGWADNRFFIETMFAAKHIVYVDQPLYFYRADSVAKQNDFSTNNPTLAFDRWQDCQDVAVRLGALDKPEYRDVLIDRGFLYLSGVLEVSDPDVEPVASALAHMLNQMDTDAVFANPRISPAHKALFARVRGVDAPKISRVPYMSYLVHRGFKTVQNTGVVQTAQDVARYIKTHAARAGKR
jgi:glycosyltransferase involved in cell wall biosynthesis